MFRRKAAVEEFFINEAMVSATPVVRLRRRSLLLLLLRRRMPRWPMMVTLMSLIRCSRRGVMYTTFNQINRILESSIVCISRYVLFLFLVKKGNKKETKRKSNKMEGKIGIKRYLHYLHI